MPHFWTSDRIICIYKTFCCYSNKHDRGRSGNTVVICRKRLYSINTEENALYDIHVGIVVAPSSNARNLQTRITGFSNMTNINYSSFTRLSDEAHDRDFSERGKRHKEERDR